MTLATQQPQQMAAGPPAELVAQVMLQGDLNDLDDGQRLDYIAGLCNHLGVSAAGKPFDLLKFQGKMVAYPSKRLAEQLRNRWCITVGVPEVTWDQDMVYVTVTAKMGDRSDTDVGAVPCNGQNAEAKSIALRKAVTQAKRRVTLSLVGLSEFNEHDMEVAHLRQAAADGPERAALELPAAKEEAKAPEEPMANLTDVRTQCAAIGQELQTVLGTSQGKRTYQGVLMSLLNVKSLAQVEALTEGQAVPLVEILQDALSEAKGDTSDSSGAILAEIEELESGLDEGQLLDAWVGTLGADNTNRELTDLSVEELTQYRDALQA